MKTDVLKQLVSGIAIRLSLFAAMVVFGTGSAAALPDSVGLYHSGDSVFILHELDSGETVYALSKRYHCTTSDILGANRSLAVEDISIGTALYVPVLNVPDNTPVSGVGQLNTRPDFTHRVMPGETVYSISRLYTGITMDEVMEWNDLANTDLSVGQLLFIRAPGVLEKGLIGPLDAPRVEHPSLAEIADSITRRAPVRMDTMNRAVFNSYYANAQKLQSDRGIATWSSGQGSASYYALHDTAPLGSVLKVRNPMNGRVLYAKVMGRIPRNKTDHRSLVKISGNAARALGVLDLKFLAEIEYLRD